MEQRGWIEAGNRSLSTSVPSGQNRLVPTDRLEVRLPLEADRRRFVALFQDAAFMEFSAGVHDEASAHTRFDGMLRTVEGLSFAKQPVIERQSGEIIGYSGAAWFEFEGAQRLEYGYRLVPAARERDTRPKLVAAADAAVGSFRGEVLAMIDAQNAPSKGVIGKLGFDFWKIADVDDYPVEMYRRSFAG